MKVRRLFRRFSGHGPLRSCYEASGAGFVLQRVLAGDGFCCEVIAPSLIPRRPGKRRKFDRHDTRLRLLQADMRCLRVYSIQVDGWLITEKGSGVGLRKIQVRQGCHFHPPTVQDEQLPANGTIISPQALYAEHIPIRPLRKAALLSG
jgi:hypothetical protein